jgi:hypothetical protein
MNNFKYTGEHKNIMTLIQELYEILEGMIYATKKDDVRKVNSLNDSFSKLFFKAFPTIPASDLGILYDNCRQSCVMAEMVKNTYDKKDWKNKHEMLLNDALDKFSKIPKP